MHPVGIEIVRLDKSHFPLHNQHCAKFRRVLLRIVPQSTEI